MCFYVKKKKKKEVFVCIKEAWPKTEMIKTGRSWRISNYLATRPINHNETGLLHAELAFWDKSSA